MREVEIGELRKKLAIAKWKEVNHRVAWSFFKRVSQSF
jgi:hypothetical protein